MIDAATRALLDDRYGRARRSRAGWIVGGIVVLLAVGYLAWQTVTAATGSVDVDTLRFEAPDRHSVTVEFQATLQHGAKLVCAVEAMDAEHGVVGWRVIEYPATDEHTRSFRETVPTVAQATTGLVRSCWIP